MKLGYSPVKATAWWCAGALVCSAWAYYHTRDHAPEFKRITKAPDVPEKAIAESMARIQACADAIIEYKAASEDEPEWNPYEETASLTDSIREQSPAAFRALARHVEANKEGADLCKKLLHLPIHHDKGILRSSRKPLQKVFILANQVGIDAAKKGRLDEAWELNALCRQRAAEMLSESDSMIDLLIVMTLIYVTDETAVDIAWLDTDPSRIARNRDRIAKFAPSGEILQSAFEGEIAWSNTLAQSDLNENPTSRAAVKLMYMPNESKIILSKQWDPRLIEGPVRRNPRDYPQRNLVPWAHNFCGHLFANSLAIVTPLVFDRFWQIPAHSRCVADALSIRIAELNNSAGAATPTSMDRFSNKPNRHDPERGIIWSAGKDFTDDNGDPDQDIVVVIPGHKQPASK